MWKKYIPTEEDRGMKTIKFMYNGIKVDGKLYRASYSKGNYRPESGLLEEDITIYGKRYKDLPDIGIKVENNSDMMTDYFDNDKIRVTKTYPHYNEVMEALQKEEAHHEKLKLKRILKSSRINLKQV